LPELQLLFTSRPFMNQRQYNARRSCSYFYTADGEIPESYVTIIEVPKLYKMLLPWIYLLFNPYDTKEWHCNLTKLNSNKCITRSQYIKYRICNEFNIFILDYSSISTMTCRQLHKN